MDLLYTSPQLDPSHRSALRLAYPVVRPPELWAHSQSFDLDPFLMMGIMRQESTYQQGNRTGNAVTAVVNAF